MSVGFKQTFLGLFCVTAMAALVGCSGADDSTPAAPPTVNQPLAFTGSLARPGAQAVTTYLRNGLYSASTYSMPAVDSIDAAPNAVNLDFSTTNTQESGVDEADRVEFDGSTFYVADYPMWYQLEGYQADIRVLNQNADASLTELTRLPVAEPEWAVHGLYLNSESTTRRLAVLSGSQPVYPVDAFSQSVMAPANLDNDFMIEIYNVDDPVNIGITERIDIDGRLLSSRRIGDRLFVVSSYTPSVEGIELNAQAPATQLENYKKILAVPTDELLPKVSLNGQQQALLTADDCYIPQQASSQDGYAQIIQVLQIDMKNPGNMQALCMSAVTSMIYASEESMYLAGSTDNTTFLHKISLSDGASYQASGSVPGILNWNGSPHLRLSEWQQTLRIVTSDYQQDSADPLHRLFSLQQQGNNLNIVGELPNATYPQPIGKPGEDVYAVRYVGERGYVVSFERIDPLYVFDLSDATNPMMLGALEIPGFSSYLQPFGNDLLLGIGQQVSFQDIPANGEVTIQPISVQAMKISLFDVRDPANPIEVATIEREQTYTPAEFDYRTLSLLNMEGKTRFALPMESWGGVSNDLWVEVENSLLVFDVEHTDQQISLNEVIELTTESDASSYIYAGEDRSVITTAGVYYLRGNQLWFHSTSETDGLIGPF